MATDLGNAKISLADSVQLNIFNKRMAAIRAGQSRLNNFDAQFFGTMESRYSAAGVNMTLTRKEMNYLGQIVENVK